MLVTVRWPGVRMAPISSISAWRQLRWKNSGAKQRITSAKRAGSRSMAAVLEWGRPSLTAHPLRCFRPGNGQTQAEADAVIYNWSGEAGLRLRRPQDLATARPRGDRGGALHGGAADARHGPAGGRAGQAGADHDQR